MIELKNCWVGVKQQSLTLNIKMTFQSKIYFKQIQKNKGWITQLSNAYMRSLGKYFIDESMVYIYISILTWYNKYKNGISKYDLLNNLFNMV
jgi:predicted ATPase